MANIGLDATSLSVYGKGVSNYQYNLINNLPRLDQKNSYYIFLDKKNLVPGLPSYNNLFYIKAYKWNKIFWDQFQLPGLIKKYRLDIFHSLTDTLPMRACAKLLLCVNEIPDYRIRLARAKGASLYTRLSQEYNRIFFGKSLKKASIIIAISQSTKSDLINKYDIDEKKIKVIYLAADGYFNADYNEGERLKIKDKYNAPSGYILHFSSGDLRDNTALVIRAYHQALSKLKDKKKLIIVGAVDHKKAGLDKIIKALNLAEDIKFTGYLAQKEDLVSLYQGADLYVDPSLYEGFGLQVVEAMACGIPVITSNVTSLPEIVADAGVLLPPQDANAFANTIVKILNDPQLNQSMRRKSLERARSFSWDINAQQTLKIYDELSFKEALF